MTKKIPAKILRGEKCSIRPIALSDVTSKYVRWLNDKEVNQYLESRFSRATLPGVRAYIKKAIKDSDTYLFAIIDSKTGEHIGNIKLGPVNLHHQCAEIGFFIGEKSFWGKGYASEAIRLIEQFAFNDLKLHKLTAGAYANNIGSVKLLEKCGFKKEGVMKDNCFFEGGFVDGIRFGKLSGRKI